MLAARYVVGLAPQLAACRSLLASIGGGIYSPAAAERGDNDLWQVQRPSQQVSSSFASPFSCCPAAGAALQSKRHQPSSAAHRPWPASSTACTAHQSAPAGVSTGSPFQHGVWSQQSPYTGSLWHTRQQVFVGHASFSTAKSADGSGSDSSGSGDSGKGSNPPAAQAASAPGQQQARQDGLKAPSRREAATAKARRLAPAVGVAAGIFGSWVGVGGGVLIVPAIMGACPGISQRLVAGTSLVAVLATAAAATRTYSAAGAVDPAAAALIAAGAVCTAPLGAWLTTRLDAKALRRILGWFLVAVALLVPLKGVLLSGLDPGSGVAAAAVSGVGWEPSWAMPLAPRAAFYAATGALAGCATGLLGIGGGTVVTPLLAAAGGMPQAAVLGTSLVAMLPPCTAALAQHARLGNVDWRLAAGLLALLFVCLQLGPESGLAAGAAAGSYFGSLTAVQAPAGVLEAAFCVGMLALGLKTLRAGRAKL